MRLSEYARNRIEGEKRMANGKSTGEVGQMLFQVQLALRHWREQKEEAEKQIQRLEESEQRLQNIARDLAAKPRKPKPPQGGGSDAPPPPPF